VPAGAPPSCITICLNPGLPLCSQLPPHRPKRGPRKPPLARPGRVLIPGSPCLLRESTGGSATLPPHCSLAVV